MHTLKSLFTSMKMNIKNFFAGLVNKFSDNKGTISFFVDVFLFIVLLFNSGYAYTNKNSTLAIMLLLFGIIVLIFNYILTINVHELKRSIKNFKLNRETMGKLIGKINICTLVFVVTVLFSFITILVNKDFQSIGSYAWNIGTIVFAFAFTKKYTFEKFVNVFEKALVFFSLVAVVIYIVRLVVGFPFSVLSFTSNNGVNYSNYFFLAFDYPEGIDTTRMISVFWEPGLYSTFLSFALMIEIAYRKKMNVFNCILFVCCILLSKSSFGYLSLIFLFFTFLIRIFKKSLVKKIIVCVIFVACVLLCIFFVDDIAKILPTSFSKLVDPLTSSVRDRIYSPQVNIEIYKQNYIFGVGITKHGLQYASYGITQTSTTTNNLACFGVCSLFIPLLFVISCFACEKLDKFMGAFLAVFVILIINKEPHNVISTTSILMFYVIEMCCDGCFEVRQIDYENNILSKFLNGNNGILVKNTGASFAIKGVAMIVSLFSLPVYITYFRNDAVLGVWLTILSFINFIMMFDFGLGNGLKNKLINAIAKNDEEKIKTLVSSSYFSIACICLGLLFVGIPLVLVLNKTGAVNFFSVFGVKNNAISLKVLIAVILIVYSSIVLELFLKLISSVLHALQKQAITSVFSLITSIILIIFASTARLIGSDTRIIVLAIVYFVSVNVPLIITTIIVFNTNPILKKAKFSFKNIDKESINDVLHLGIRFFIIQLCLLMLNSTNEILITSLLHDSSLIVEYNKYYKLFTVVITFASLIAGPVWGVVSKSFSEKKFEWIKKVNKILTYIGIGLGVLSLALAGLLQIGFDVWLDEASIPVNYYISFTFAGFTILWVFLYLFTSISNGICALKTQVIGLIIAAVLKIPVTLLLLKGGVFGDSSWCCVVLANIIVLLPVVIIQPIENYLVIRKNERSLSYEKVQ